MSTSALKTKNRFTSPSILGQPLRLSRSGNVFPFGSTPLWINRTPKLITAIVDGNVVAKSGRALIAHEEGLTPVYYFPEADVAMDLLVKMNSESSLCPRKGTASYFTLKAGEFAGARVAWTYPDPIPAAEALGGYIAFYFDRIDHWFEDGDEIFGSPPDPFVRIDVRSLVGRLTIEHEEEVIADTSRAKVLYETGLSPRFYIPEADFRVELLPSAQSSVCVYKGVATYAHLRLKTGVKKDAVWGYPEPTRESHGVEGCWSLEFEQFDETHLDGRRVLPPIGRADGRPVLTRGDKAGPSGGVS